MRSVSPRSELAAAGRDGAVIVARRSHHRIAEDEPDVVVAAIRDVLEASDGELR